MAIADTEFLKRLVGEKAIVIHFRRHISKEKDRYKIYLPKQFNGFWEQVRTKGMDIEVIVLLRVGT